MRDDFRIALRRLTKAPWFAAAVIGTLAIAIGGSTCVFSVVNGVLLRPLPYRSSEELVAIVNTGQRPADNISPRDVADWQRDLRGLTLAAYYKDPVLTLETGTRMVVPASLMRYFGSLPVLAITWPRKRRTCSEVGWRVKRAKPTTRRE